MGRILAIETATKVCSVAVAGDGAVLGETSLFVPHLHAERLVQMINSLLDSLSVTYANLDAVAVSMGPGSFTGLRIGLSVAKGIAFGQNKKLIMVPTLEAIAGSAARFADIKQQIVAILHARAEEFYYSSFELDGSLLKTQTNVRVAEAEKIAEEFSSDVIFVGEGTEEFSRIIMNGTEEHDTEKRRIGKNQLRNVPATAAAVAVIAGEKFNRGEFSDLRTSVPLYIKDFVAIKGNSLKKLLEKT